MSAYLEAVAQTREQRDHAHAASEQAQAAFVHALTVARRHHSLREIARAAGITHNGVKYLTEQEPRDA